MDVAGWRSDAVRPVDGESESVDNRHSIMVKSLSTYLNGWRR
jgi:hypothetical protein